MRTWWLYTYKSGIPWRQRAHHPTGSRQHKLGAVVVCPEDFPEAKDVLKWKFPLEGYKDPSATRGQQHTHTQGLHDLPETEEQVETIRFLCKDVEISKSGIA